MYTLDTSGISPVTSSRVLSFLNQAQKATDISRSDTLLKDDPDSGVGQYRIGKTVASRIISKRESLESGQFQSLGELSGIAGLGQDKFHDLIYSFHFSAADEFVRRMYMDVIDDHWKLEHFSQVIESRQAFNKLVNDPVLFQDHVVGMMQDQLGRHSDDDVCTQELTAKILCGTEAQLEVSEKEAGFSWALWLYRMGTKRWFGFEQVRAEILRYFHTYSASKDRIDWRVFRNFQSKSILRSSTYDLPVTVNYKEQTISLWRAEVLE